MFLQRSPINCILAAFCKMALNSLTCDTCSFVGDTIDLSSSTSASIDSCSVSPQSTNSPASSPTKCCCSSDQETSDQPKKVRKVQFEHCESVGMHIHVSSSSSSSFCSQTFSAPSPAEKFLDKQGKSVQSK